MVQGKGRASIREPVRRQLRQEAGFGCCKCGNPIFQYHHIVQGSQKREDIMILCPVCHHEATVGAMTGEEQRFWKVHPSNIEKGYVEGKLKINQKLPAVTIGTNQFVGDGDFVLVDQDSLLSLRADSSGRLLFSVQLYNRNDQLIALIEHNEWISGDPLPWDLQSGFQWLRIRQRLGDIELEIDARRFPIEIRADLWRKSQNFQFNPWQTRFNGIVRGVGLMDVCFVAMRLVVDTTLNEFRIEPDPRFCRGVLVSWPDIQERVEKGLKAWEQLRQQS